MLYNVYAVFDKIDCQIIHVGLAPNDASFVRRESVNLMRSFSLDDVDIFHVGSIDLESCSISPCEKRVVDFSSYQINQDVRRNNLKRFGFSDEEIDARFRVENEADCNNSSKESERKE